MSREHDVEDAFVFLCSFFGILYLSAFIVFHNIWDLIGAIFFFLLDALCIWMDYDIIKHPEEWESALD
jgi:hypothetical protein